MGGAERQGAAPEKKTLEKKGIWEKIPGPLRRWGIKNDAEQRGLSAALF